MNMPDIMFLIREQTFTDTDQLPDNILIKYINIVYHDIESKLVSFINENKFYDRKTIDLVAGQNEYILPTGSSTNLGPNNILSTQIRKLLTVGVKYDPLAIIYEKAKETNQGNLEKDLETYRKNQNYSKPFFILQDDSVFIYPEPKVSVVGGLKIEIIQKLTDITATTAESDIGIPRDFHKLIILGAKPRIFDQRGKYQEKERAENAYKQGISQMISELTDLICSPLPRGSYDAKRFMY